MEKKNEKRRKKNEKKDEKKRDFPGYLFSISITPDTSHPTLLMISVVSFSLPQIPFKTCL